MTIRFGILCGVSTDTQAAEDKNSIDDQIATCRKSIKVHGGVEVACYIMDGYSRTGYDSLADAMNDIPPLAQAIQEADKYDVLILDNFDRLGDLGMMVSTRFKKLKKQLYSARQSGKLQDPSTYDPYMDESGDISIGVEYIIQKYRLSKLQRGYKLGMTQRHGDGLHTTGNAPIGYVKVAKDKPYEVDPIYAPLVIQMKDDYLAGKSLSQIATELNEKGILTPQGKKYYLGNVRRILVNPYYSGKVAHSYHKGKNPEGLSDGAHTPLWTWDEHERIRETMGKRFNTTRESTRTWSGILYCETCGQRLKMMHGFYRCLTGPDHIGMYEQEANYLIPREIVRQLKGYKDTASADIEIPDNSRAVAELNRQIEKVQKGYESELYTLAQAQGKIKDIKAKIQALEDVEEQAKQKRLSHERFKVMRGDILEIIDKLPDMLRERPQLVNNKFIRQMITRITVTPERNFTIQWRNL